MDQNNTPPLPPTTPVEPTDAGANKLVKKNWVAVIKAKKRLLIIAGAVIVLVVVLLIVLMAMFTVSKKDYQAALDQFNKVADANSSLTSSVSSLGYDVDSATDTVFNNDVDSAQTSLDKLKTANNNLSTLKAAKVGDGKKQYDAFNAKLSSYETYAANIVSSVKTLRPALKVCNDVSSAASSEINAALTACVSRMGTVNGDVADADFKQFFGAIKDGFTQYLALLTKKAALSDPYGTDYNQYTALRDQSYKVQDAISSASKDFISNAEKHANAVDPKDAANALGTFLDKQAL
jgi:hypothetical protein